MTELIHPLRQFRKDKGLTQGQLASMLARTTAQISRWENFLREPRGRDLQKIAEVTGIPIDVIVKAGSSHDISEPAQ